MDGLFGHMSEYAKLSEKPIPLVVLQERANRLRSLLPRSPGEVMELARVL
jgi:hypothetical protein